MSGHGPLFLVGSAPPAEQGDGLDVVGLGEHIDGLHLAERVSPLGESGYVSGKGSGVAGDIDDAAGLATGQGLKCLGSAPCAWGV